MLCSNPYPGLYSFCKTYPWILGNKIPFLEYGFRCKKANHVIILILNTAIQVLDYGSDLANPDPLIYCQVGHFIDPLLYRNWSKAHIVGGTVLPPITQSWSAPVGLGIRDWKRSPPVSSLILQNKCLHVSESVYFHLTSPLVIFFIPGT